MRILLAPTGTRGDVQPHIALAQSLAARGHDAIVCASSTFRALVEGAGIAFFDGGPDVHALIEKHGGARIFAPTAFTSILREHIPLQLAAIVRCAEEAGGVDAVVASLGTVAAPSAAEWLGVPLLWSAFQPNAFPTREHPFILLGLRSLGAALNKLSWSLGFGVMGLVLRRVLNDARLHIGLAEVKRDVTEHVVGAGPILSAFDPDLASVPADWAAATAALGAWQSPIVADGDALPARLCAFLDAGDPPVYAGFGSMPIADPRGRARAIVDGVRAAGARLILHDGWGGLGVDDDDHDDDRHVFLLRGPVEHSALFPRVAAVMHHCGAGTTSTAARAGTPQIPVPHGSTNPGGRAASPLSAWPPFRCRRRCRRRRSPPRSPRPRRRRRYLLALSRSASACRRATAPPPPSPFWSALSRVEPGAARWNDHAYTALHHCVIVRSVTGDPFSDILALAEATSVVSGGFEGGGTWGLRFPATGKIAFGVVARGTCWARVDGQRPARLDEGDVVLVSSVRQGFFIGSSPHGRGAPPPPLDARRRGGPWKQLGTGSECFVLYGAVLLHPADADLVTGALPALVHVRASSPRAAALRFIIEQLWEERTAPQPGTAVVSSQLAQLLFVQLLRLCLSSGEALPTGWLRAIRDDRLLRALRLMHGAPGAKLTLAQLAKAAAMSRTSFAVRFRDVVGVAPLTYLTDWRMRLARRALRAGTAASIGALAASLGYASEGAFSTAFRRATGMAPRDYRASHSD